MAEFLTLLQKNLERLDLQLPVLMIGPSKVTKA